MGGSGLEETKPRSNRESAGEVAFGASPESGPHADLKQTSKAVVRQTIKVNGSKP